jgi:hypothetical protein
MCIIKSAARIPQFATAEARVPGSNPQTNEELRLEK